MSGGGDVRGRGNVVAPGIGTTVDEGGAGIQGGVRGRTFRGLPLGHISYTLDTAVY